MFLHEGTEYINRSF